MKITAKTDIGIVRDNNQDSYAAGELSGGAAFAIVCDGMGGAAEGALASSVAVNAIREKLTNSFFPGMSDISVRSLLISSVENANKAVYDLSLTDKKYDGMGTTVVASIVRNGFAYVVHAGDSRAYLIHNNEIRQITKDHSVVQNMLEKGEITSEEAFDHPDKHIITRALGVDENVRVDFAQEEFENDILLLCSDGLTNYVHDDEIKEILTDSVDDEKVSELIEKANYYGGGDNITVVALSM
ncbi:MAG: Stp1/IreP family PP2C-type Ser/Thr phosphatase [Clostridia bacterium]|nr:Stp1/IreP family PP2C-type Ser/Thr phosphatase [Clostridia bacterium]